MRSRLLLVFMLLIPTFSSGCAVSPSPSEPTYTRSFRLGAYDAAYTQAQSAPPSEQANLISAMSLQALGRGDEARASLESLSRSPTREIRGRALATLGLLEYENDDNAAAARYIDLALQDLSGAERERAIWFRRSLGVTDSPTPARDVQTWTVQVGAFQSKVSADQAARSGRDRAWPGPIEVHREVSAGQVLHAVRIGRFATRREADRFAEQVGGYVRQYE